MKIKTIKQVIKKKFDSFAASIEDERVRKIVQDNTIITGGCIASMLLREEVNDFDCYFRTRDAALAVAQHYVSIFKPKNKHGIECPMYVQELPDRIAIVVKSAGIASEEGTAKPYEYFESSNVNEKAGEYVGDIVQGAGNVEEAYEDTEKAALATDDDGKPKYRPVFMSSNAITLSGKVQLVLRFYGEPDVIHENYDFVHCTNCWTSWDNKLTLRQEALESLMTKELRYVGSKYPVCSVIRLRKFIARQWTINAGQILKMIMQINELDLTNIEVLREQLVGVDSAFFCELITKLKEKDSDKVNAAYLVEIIDRIF